MTQHFLGFRARAFSIALICFGLAAVAPRGIKGFWAFVQAPPGLSVVALALVAIGCSVEETGSLRRIRLGIGLRIVAVAVLVFAIAWAWSLGAPLPGLATMALVLGGAGAIGVGIALKHDWATFSDVRHGQTVRLEEITPDGLHIECNGERIAIAAADILQVSPASSLEGRAVIFLVHEEARSRKNMEPLPWIGATLRGDVFVLTEHQAGMDMEELLSRAIVMIGKSRMGGEP